MHCKSENEINNWVDSNILLFNFMFINAYFDGSDYVQPIKFAKEDKYYLALNSMIGQGVDLYLK